VYWQYRSKPDGGSFPAKVCLKAFWDQIEKRIKLWIEEKGIFQE